jgi:hypothetical protein
MPAIRTNLCGKFSLVYVSVTIRAANLNLVRSFYNLTV